jgi:SAM-dependent methyltransferase
MTLPIDNNNNTITRLIGFDTAGELFQDDEKILRGIYPEYESLYRDVLENCEKNNLFQYGIVNTAERKGFFDPEHTFNLLLEHERVPFITYPHEWSASMLKDAALFHIDLFIQLEKYGLTLKDWHSYNILFKNTEPIFIDFLSIIPIGNLEKEEYLNPPQVPLFFGRFWDTRSNFLYEMYRRMYVPYFLLPMTIMAQKKYKIARKRIFETTLNASNTTITPSEVFGINIVRRILFEVRKTLKKISLTESHQSKQKFFIKLRNELDHLDVQPPSSAYVNYYNLKNENFDFKPTADWTNKQLVVYNALQELKPQTVLDIACNTGWFSIVAANLGSSVVAVDIDESCVDKLYEYAKNEHLSILPLVIDITHATEDVFPLNQDELIYQKRMTHTTPLLISAERRLQCDMVLVLALIHHLVLGQNMDFNQIRKTLDPLSNKYLLIEFIAKTDNLIVEDPDFFPAFKANPDAFDWYTMENLMVELKTVFKTIDIVDSYPETRKLLICKK